MTENLTTNLQGLFEEVADRGRTAGATTQEAFNEMIDDVLTGKLEVGEMDEDNDVMGIKEQLKGRYAEYAEMISAPSEAPAVE